MSGMNFSLALLGILAAACKLQCSCENYSLTFVFTSKCAVRLNRFHSAGFVGVCYLIPFVLSLRSSNELKDFFNAKYCVY